MVFMPETARPPRRAAGTAQRFGQHVVPRHVWTPPIKQFSLIGEQAHLLHVSVHRRDRFVEKIFVSPQHIPKVPVLDGRFAALSKVFPTE